MKFQQLRFFVAVYEEGSFSAGAMRVNATQSGLSMHVRQLEKRYGVSLLERSSTGVVPTEAGRWFYKKAVAVLSASADAEDTLKQLSGTLSDHIHVGLMPSFTGSVLSPALRRFTQEHKYIKISIKEAYSGQLAKDVEDGNLDFAIVPAYNNDLNLMATPMGQDRECLVCAANSTLNIRGAAVLSALPPQRLLVPSQSNTRRARIEQYLSINQIEVAEIMELDSMMGTLHIIEQSGWVSILPGIIGLQDKDGVKRIYTPLESPVLTVDYIRIEHRARPLGNAAQTFAHFLQEELNNALEVDPISAR